jgi:Domain of unknown function (DUF4112)
LPQTLQAEVLTPRKPRFSPRKTRNYEALRDENLDLLAHLLDDWFQIPGTQFRFGLDGIIGLVPGFGDILGGLLSCILIFAAWLRGIPYVTLTRMTVNVGLDVLIGSIPLFGDIFDAAWKANRRNYALMQLHLRQPHRHTWRDWAFLMVLFTVLVAILLVPVLLITWLLLHLQHTH